MRVIIFFLLLLSFSANCQQRYFGRIVAGTTPPDVPTLDNAIVVGDGNSYFTTLNSLTPAPSVVMTLSPFSTNGSYLYNFGVSSQTTGAMLSDVASQVLPLYTPGVENILLFHEGSNDIYFNGRVDSAIARTLRYCSIVRTAGFKIILSTLIPRNQSSAAGDNVATYNAKMVEYNDSLIALVGTGQFDGLIRPDLEAVFSSYVSAGYYGDFIHPSQTGHNKYAELYLAAILELY